MQLDNNKLLWGSIAPDYLPKYKFIRHYKDESINYVVNEILKIILFTKYVDISIVPQSIVVASLSKKIGIISHYLSDYVCYPHAQRWTFSDSMIKHIKYENNLNDFAKSYKFDQPQSKIYVPDIDLDSLNLHNTKKTIKKFIDQVVEEYNKTASKTASFSNDLDFANFINRKMIFFIIDTMRESVLEGQETLAFQI
ncbi:zinc dependent phospholipase C family protein [Soehngenia longivitae]|uniref:zinc dependent phospholipase C family protein n=1 Tax=Soehngenia longivitae TaxID=2562294 RepID=UPI001FD77A19